MLRQDRVRISSSHRPAPSQANLRLRKDGPDERRHIQTAHRESLKRQEVILTAFEKAWTQRLTRVLDSDGLLRASAHDAARAPRTSDRVERFPRVLRAYCAMLMGYDDRFVVEEHLLIRMKQLLAVRLAKLKTEVKQSISRPRINPQTCRSVVRSEFRPLDRAMADALAEEALQGLEKSLLDLAAKGRRMRQELPRGYVGIQIRVAGLGRTTSAVVITDPSDGETRIKALQTSREFNRVQRMRFRARKAAYANRPSFVRH